MNEHDALIHRIQAHHRWEDLLIQRELMVSDHLAREITSYLSQPRQDVRDWLFDRLLYGCSVIDQRGGDTAPDNLWTHFEALLLAWQCCTDALTAQGELQVLVARNRKKVQRRTYRARTKTPNFVFRNV